MGRWYMTTTDKKKIKNHTSAVRSTQKDIDHSPAKQGACNISIARVTGWVYSREGHIGDSLANARVNRAITFSLVLRTETV